MKKAILIKENDEIKQIEATFNDVYDMYGGIIKSIALRKSRYVPSRYVDDVLQDAVILAMKVFETYDITKGALFLSFLSITLNNSIQRISSKYYSYDKNEMYLGDSDVLVEELYEEVADSDDKAVPELLSLLTKEQATLAEFRMRGIYRDEIMKEMGISRRYYDRLLREIKKILGDYL